MERMKLFLIAIIFIVLGGALEAAFNVQEFTTPKGIKVRYRHDATTPVIAVCFSFDAGSAYDKNGLEGTATLLASMMTEGTHKRDGEELSALLQDLAVDLSYTASTEYFSGSLTTLRENKDKAFDLLKETFFDSSYAPEAFDRVRKKRLTVLAMKEHDPNYQVSAHMRRLLYGNHPYSKPSLGIVSSVHQIELSNLKDFFKNFSRNGLLVSIAGNISKDEIEKHIDDVFDSLPEASSLDPIPDIGKLSFPMKLVIEQHIPQTVMGFAQKGLLCKDPDYMTFYLLNRILSERLWLQVRDKKGLAYVVYSAPVVTKKAGFLTGGCGTKNETAALAMNSILENIKDIKEKGFSEDEFQEAKSYLLGSYILNFEDTPTVASIILGLFQMGYPVEYVDIRNDLMQRITKEQAQEVAKKVLAPDHMGFVFYGSPKDVLDAH